MASELKQEWKNNFKSLWKYSQAVHQGKNAHPSLHLIKNHFPRNAWFCI